MINESNRRDGSVDICDNPADHWLSMESEWFPIYTQISIVPESNATIGTPRFRSHMGFQQAK